MEADRPTLTVMRQVAQAVWCGAGHLCRTVLCSSFRGDGRFLWAGREEWWESGFSHTVGLRCHCCRGLWCLASPCLIGDVDGDSRCKGSLILHWWYNEGKRLLWGGGDILKQHSSNIFFDVQNKIGFRTGQDMVSGELTRYALACVRAELLSVRASAGVFGWVFTDLRSSQTQEVTGSVSHSAQVTAVRSYTHTHTHTHTQTHTHTHTHND